MTADPGTGGAVFATALGTWSGDSANFPGCFIVIASGSEGSWTFAQAVGGAGAVAAGVQRMTLASDDPAVSALGATGDAAATQGSTGSISAKLRTVTSQLNTIASTGIPITGTVTVGSHDVTNAGTFAVQAAQSGTWNVTNISGTVSLPTGASTAAKQPALGTAGTASADVITVQGIASMTPLLVTATGSGNFTVVQSTASNLNATVVGTGTFAVQATCTNAGTFAVQAACTNAGTFAVQVDGSALTALQKIDDPVLVDDAAFTPATSSVMMAGFEADETATDSVDEGDAGAARMTLDRKVITTPQPHTAGGLSISRDIDLDNGTLTIVKASPGQVYGWTICNTTTTTVYVKFYDATSGTLGTGTPVLTIGIPGNASDDTTLAQSFGGLGIAFATGICVGAGTGVADADNTDPGANGVVANIYYK